MPAHITFDDAEHPGKTIVVEANPQTAVTPGPSGNTATINTPDGKRMLVVGDYRDVQVRLQAAAARAHGSGEAPQQNTPMS